MLSEKQQSHWIGQLAAQAASELAGLVAERDVDLFVLRLERFLPDLIAGLQPVYGERPEFVAWVQYLVSLMAGRYAERPLGLRRLDIARQLRPDWLQEPKQLGYVCYVDRFAGSLSQVHQHLDHLSRLGVTYVHLMSLLQARAGNSDGGYAIADYRATDSAIGHADDLERLTRALRERGISTCMDLVLNHVAYEHAWAQAARQGDARYRDYFWLFEDRAVPDQYERTLPEIFPESSPGSFTRDRELNQWVWTTFNDFQWDLNWTNPQVFQEIADLVLFWANRGVEIFRLDAIAFIWKRMGTDCQNQAEVHDIVHALRAIARIAAPAVAFKAEAIVSAEQLPHYLGTGEHAGKVSDLAYHNSLMAHIWSSLASRDVRPMTHALRRLPEKPRSTSWASYLRCHDDIGWAIGDEDAAAVGLDGAAHRSFLVEYYSGRFTGSHARGAVFQHNSTTGDRRSCGTTASLAGLELALENGDERLVQVSIERILLAHAVIMAFPGVPLVYMGDEIGLLNDYTYREDPARRDDNRWIHRPAMPWERVERIRVDGTMEQRLFGQLVKLIHARKQTPQLHAEAPLSLLELDNPHVLGFVRSHPLGDLVALFNFTEREQIVEVPRPVYPDNRIPGQHVDIWPGNRLQLPPYGRFWLAAP